MSLRLLRPRLALVALVVAGGTGCVYRTPETHLPAVAPAALEIDDVTVVSEHGAPADAQTTEDVQREAKRLLLATKPRSGDGNPARIRAHVVLGQSGSIDDSIRRDGIAVMGYFYAPFGLAIDNQEIRVDVTVETGGKTYTGHGEATRLGSIYAHARKRALAVALDRALADAASRAGT